MSFSWPFAGRDRERAERRRQRFLAEHRNRDRVRGPPAAGVAEVSTDSYIDEIEWLWKVCGTKVYLHPLQKFLKIPENPWKSLAYFEVFNMRQMQY